MSRKDIGDDFAHWSGAKLPSKDLWKELAKPLDREWAFMRDYLDRLDTVCPGEWDETQELIMIDEPTSIRATRLFIFKCRVQILGVIREGVGEHENVADAQMHAFAAACQMFGMGQQKEPET